MKKISILLSILMLLGAFPAYASDVAIVQTYQSVMGTEQGVNNWYYTYFNGDSSEELVYSDSRWRGPSGGVLKVDLINTVVAYEIGYTFKAPTKGMINLSGSVTFNANYINSSGDGVTCSIVKDGQVLWSDSLLSTGEPISYDVDVSVRVGDEIQFRVNANKSNGNDMIVWWPSASYIAKAFAGTGGKPGFKYMQKMNGELTEIFYNREQDRFNGTDGVGFMSDYDIMPSDDCSFVTRYAVTEDGKYRVSAELTAKDRRCNGNLVYVYKNNELIWQQLVPGNEAGKIDVRFTAKKDDIIDVEVAKNEFAGFNYSDWKLDIKKFEGSLPFCNASTSSGANYGTEEEFTLSSKIGTTQGNGAQYYALYNTTKFPMTYDASAKQWSVDVKGDATAAISADKVTLAAYRGEPGIDIDIAKTGTIKIEGNLPISEGSNGILAKILLNDREIWSNRVGGELSKRFDEETDKRYFINDINVVADVSEGDVLSFVFSRWRTIPKGTALDIKDIKVKYIGGEILSETTKWKIAQSIVLDTEQGIAYYGGNTKNVSIFVNNGTTYLAKADADEILSGVDAEAVNINGSDYVPLRAAAEANGKTVTWGADRLVVIHDGLSVFFGIPEFSEMKSVLKGGSLLD